MVRAIEALNFKDRFSLSQLITYKYYTGRKYMFDSDFQSGIMLFLVLMRIVFLKFFMTYEKEKSIKFRIGSLIGVVCHKDIW